MDEAKSMYQFVSTISLRSRVNAAVFILGMTSSCDVEQQLSNHNFDRMSDHEKSELLLPVIPMW